MIRCMIVDDEMLARKGIEVLLNKAGDCELVLSTGNPREALEYMLDHPVDVLFLDIKMPEMSGMEVLRQLRSRQSSQRPPYVILVTAFDEYALQAFDYEALDYLVKPFHDQRFFESLHRARKRLEIKHNVESTSANSRVVEIKTRAGTVKLFENEICWVESMGHYMMFHTTKRSYLSRARMSELQSQLSSEAFVRVHRQALVNRNHVLEVTNQAATGHQLLTSDGSTISVSRRRWPEVCECFKFH